MAYRHIMDRAMSGETVEMWGDPERAHDVVYVKDFCQMLYRALIASGAGGTYNVGTGRPVSLREQIEGIVDVFSPNGKRSQIVHLPEKPNAQSYTFDISNARQELGYEPQYDYMGYLQDFKQEMESDLFDCEKGDLIVQNEF
jgi:UDP-glucose 4-epimerase